MKIITTIVLTLSLGGCAHNQSWVGPAVAGAAVGVIINESMNHNHRHHAPPPVYRAPPRYKQCYSIPLYDRYGYYAGYRTQCH